MKKDDVPYSIDLERTHNIHILSENILEEDLNKDNYIYLVAKINDDIVGYIGISHILEIADIISIVVSKNYTNLGIASLMLNEIFKICNEKNIKKILLEVRKSNIAAQSLYEKHDFKKISVRKKYYDNIEDAYIYEKEL